MVKHCHHNHQYNNNVTPPSSVICIILYNKIKVMSIPCWWVRLDRAIMEENGRSSYQGIRPLNPEGNRKDRQPGVVPRCCSHPHTPSPPSSAKLKTVLYTDQIQIKIWDWWCEWDHWEIKCQLFHIYRKSFISDLIVTSRAYSALREIKSAFWDSKLEIN